MTLSSNAAREHDAPTVSPPDVVKFRHVTLGALLRASGMPVNINKVGTRDAMILAHVIGQVVSTVKHPDYYGYALLVVQPIDPAGRPTGKPLIAIDAVQAGTGDTVIVIDEGGSGRSILNAPNKRTLRTVIAGIVDDIAAVEHTFEEHA